MTTPDLAGLCERLRASDPFYMRGPDYEPHMIEPSELRLEAAAAIERLVAVLKRIDDMCPATCETSLAHDMAQIARTALEGASDDR